ncbi:nuclear transport factor 2 family protein [Actinokineospora sp. G85]|uniref:nuclear transport factor 2 family protein n=1 Tax=Actinokineospora sp. G85 TaxID=3406626 RepID=UPI003C72DE80
MTTVDTAEDVAALRAQVRLLTDHAEVDRLCDRYVANLDQSRHDDSWFGSVFTDDIRMTFPMGEYTGLAGLAAFHEMARTTFERTHHMSANHAIRLDGDSGVVRAHLTAVHLRAAAEPGASFGIGGHYEAQVRRTAQGWRISRFAFDLVWRAGDPPGAAHPE